MRRFSILALALLAGLPAFGATFTVNDLGDDPDDTSNGVCDTAGAGTVCTLRAAIMEANAAPGSDEIRFGVTGEINIGSALPGIVGGVTIRGETAPLYAGVPLVAIDGQSTVPVGLDFTSGDSSVRALQVFGFTTAGIRIQNGDVVVSASYIGPVLAGTANVVGIEIAGGAGSAIQIDVDGVRNVISGNENAGILISGGSDHVIAGNYIGTDPAGTAALGNGTGVLVTSGSNVRVGADTTSVWNVISGNSTGVDIQAGSGIVVSGNYIGTDATGTTFVPNTVAGVRVAASGNTVGTTAARNIVSGNIGPGILIVSTSAVVVRNNYVGPDVTGNVGIGNNEEGILVVNSSNVDIGGTVAGEGNVVSYNGSDGISIAESNDVRVYGNIAGLNAAGNAILGNGFAGIAIGAGTNILVGSLTGSGRNVVSGNSFDGILSFAGTNNIFEANRVGTNAAGTAAESNLGTGILIALSDGDIVRSNLVSGNDGHGIELTFGVTDAVLHSNVIGLSADLSTAIPNTGDGVNVCDTVANTVVGSVALGGNTIANNGANGIGVEPTALLSNTWAANSIYDNTGLGIDLDVDGPTANDAGDIDTGANNLQNFPVLVSAVTTATGSQVRGTINTTPSTAITVHVYSSPAAEADPSGFGEGRTYLGSTSFTTDGSGNASWIMNGAAATVNHVVSATATAPDGTSEFSANVTMAAAPAVQFSQPLYTVSETGVSVTITVTRSGDLSAISTVQYTTSNNTATAGSDYSTASGTLTFNPAEASQTFNVSITNDALDEPTELVTLTLSNPTAATLGAQSTAQLEITDDDPPPAITISNVSLAEGNAGSTNFIFTISLSAVSGQQVQVSYTTTNGTATSGSDYTTTSAVATIPAGTGSVQLTVPVVGDNVVEPDETFTVDLTNPVNATISDGQGLGTIQNDDAATILISDVSLAEGNAGTTNFVFDVTLSAPSATPVTVNYATADGTAAAPSDYAAIPTTTLTFPALSTSQQITVAVAGDALVEPNETFFVNLSSPSGAAFGDNQGLGTIQNDESVPTILISDVSLAEGNAGTTNFVFNVTLSAPSATPVTVNYATADGTAAAPSDYTAIPTTTLTFPALSTSQQITVAVAGDALVEPSETFFVNLSSPSGAAFGDNQGLGTIQNDESVPAILISDVSLAEGNSGATNFVFNVTLSAPSATPVTVNYATADGTAAAPSDYTAIPTTTLTFPALSTSQQITVAVAGDALVEPNETFFVNLSSPSGAAFGDNQALGTISNDDLTADLSVTKTASSPTFTSGQPITFTITVANAGPGSAPNTIVTDVLPAGTTFVSSSASCTGTTTVSCNLGTLNSGESTSVSIVVTATGTSTITNTATVASTASDPATANDSGTVTLSPAPTDDIPTLSAWMLILLGAALAVFAARRL